MKKSWDVNVNGTVHTVEYKTNKLIVNGQKYKLKSQNWFVHMVDYPITIDGVEIRVVAIGNKVDLAVGGKYLGSGEEYVPLSKMPAICNVFIGISCIGGYFLAGLYGLLIGVLFSFLVYIKAGLKGNMKAVIGAFVGCTVIQIILLVIIMKLRTDLGV